MATAKIKTNSEEGSKVPKEDGTETYGGDQDYAENPDSDDNPESYYDKNSDSDLSDIMFDLVRDFSAIVQTLSKEFTNLLPGKKNSESKSKMCDVPAIPAIPDDVPGGDEANEESQCLAVIYAVLTIKPSQDNKIYVNWDKLEFSGSSRSRFTSTGTSLNFLDPLGPKPRIVMVA
jgi:hypothetical protein